MLCCIQSIIHNVILLFILQHYTNIIWKIFTIISANALRWRRLTKRLTMTTANVSHKFDKFKRLLFFYNLDQPSITIHQTTNMYLNVSRSLTALLTFLFSSSLGEIKSFGEKKVWYVKSQKPVSFFFHQ